MVLLATSSCLATEVTAAQSVFELAVKGASCKQNAQGNLLCKYQVGKDLEFSITAVGEADSGISFLRSNVDGDYFARFGVVHGCIIVAQGKATATATATSARSEYAFVSPKNGRVYRTWQECQGAKQ